MDASDCQEFISYQPTKTFNTTTVAEHQLKLLESLIDNIQQELE